MSGLTVAVQEVELKEKPERMLQLSAKATVPVLELADGQVLDESLEIMLWALRQNDPLGMLHSLSDEASVLIARNDNEFKPMLDRYKYPERFPEFPMLHYRAQGEVFLNELNTRLDKSQYFFGDDAGIADLALMPFIRQFASVDRHWFDASGYAALRAWLDAWIASDLFIQVMRKR